MNIAVIGKSGQLASALAALNGSEQVGSPNIVITCLGRSDIDVSSQADVLSKLKNLKANVVINAAAYTAVDKAETEKEQAFALNEVAVKNLVDVCRELDMRLLHVSTDFVFSGDKSTPYEVNDPIKPLGVYGESKAAGEVHLVESGFVNSCIVRTAWVYSQFGNNFVKTMLRLMNEKPSLGVVGDQVGTPTSAHSLAKALLKLATNHSTGIFHWTDAGVASWYDFAVAIQDIAFEMKLLNNKIKINSIATSDYPTPAQRPSYSVLDKSRILNEVEGIEINHWRDELVEVMKRIKQERVTSYEL